MQAGEASGGAVRRGGEASTRAARSANVRNRGEEAPIGSCARPIQPSSTRPQLTRAAGRARRPATPHSSGSTSSTTRSMHIIVLPITDARRVDEEYLTT